MTDKQNTIEIIRFGKPKKAAMGLPGAWIGYLGVNHQGYGDAAMEDGHDRPVGSKWVDIWGTGWQKEFPDVMGFPKGNPLADPASLAGYRWPDPDDERIYGRIYLQADNKRNHNSVFLCGSHRDTLWEKAYMLVGMENTMAYFYTEPEYAREILHRIMDFQLGIARHYERAGIEIACLGDDLGTQTSMILSPAIIDDFLMPEYRRLFGFYNTRNILINFHSCGHIEPLLERFISLGVNILNPVQATANNLAKVRAVTKGKMALHGGVSTGLVMDGPVTAIRQAVRDAIRLLGKDGGYFCAPDQGMPFPEEHMEAFREAVEEFGSYPLR